MEDHNCPFEVTRLDESVIEELKAPCKGIFLEPILLGSKRYFMTEGYLEHAETIYNMPLRPDDIFVITYPRSGTTWTQELVWLINNNLDYDTAQKIPLTDRYPFLESSAFITRKIANEMKTQITDERARKAFEGMTKPATEILAETPSPRFIKSHLPLSLLPPNLLDTKVVYVARDPRDVVVSYYHFTKSNKMMEFTGDLKVFFNLFIRNLQTWSPFFEHVKEAWQQRHHPNLLFLFYEDLIKDLAGVAKRVAKFFGKEYTEEQFAALAQYLHFDNFKNNKAVDLQNMREAGVFKAEMKFVRKGKSGGWRESFDPEMTEQAERWMAEHLRGTDLVFPTVDN